MIKHSLLGILLFLFASCANKYKITGDTSVRQLDGKMVFLKGVCKGEQVVLDSAEVIHGSFKMDGNIDSAQMVTLYMDEEGVMPIVLEEGHINITIHPTGLKAAGTPLNDNLYTFIDKKNSINLSIEELSRKEAKMILNGDDPNVIHQQLTKESEILIKEMKDYIKTFMSQNYDNVVGPSVFLMLCSSFPYPILTPEMEEILNDAPQSFTEQNQEIKEYIATARENMARMNER